MEQLRMIARTLELGRGLGVDLWLRGGWAMDFYLGHVTREHVDIDWFAWAQDAAALRRELPRHGYEPRPGPPPEQQLDFTRAGVDSSFALLDRDDESHLVVAGGPWAGERWPEGMLDGHLGAIDGVVSPIVAPLAQIEIKEMMPVWVPGRPRRAKDAADVALLMAALSERGSGAENPGR